tara:strand:- start:122 stop:469 length:348 start_codon:yes stop_codon:yes gene_type:complete
MPGEVLLVADFADVFLRRVEFRIAEALLYPDGRLRVYFSSTEAVPDMLMRSLEEVQLNGEVTPVTFHYQIPCLVGRDVTTYAEFSTPLRLATHRRFESASATDALLELAEIAETA